ncbi:MAG: hypothetical protein CMJ65_08585 [Planctomycetaceae bacterium]|jgi:5-hydroxyisourate hydrolase-like protein (transthyretin family)|nr:hypothetical protein [Planctomycetaceae bacterium]
MATAATQSNTRAHGAILTLIMLIVVLVVMRVWQWAPSNPLGTVPVVVTMLEDGQPVSNVSVTLFPKTEDAVLRPASGTTDSNGRCLLTTWRFEDGATPGPYGVGVAKIPTETLKFSDPKYLAVDPVSMYMQTYQQKPADKSEWPEKLMAAETSGLEVTVKADGPNEFRIDVGK